MLLTMLEEYKRENERMPNEERIDKVDESMENLEEVVRERNRAYYELEVGTPAEQEREVIQGPFGIPEGYVQKEHVLPFLLNGRYRAHLKFRYRTNFGPEVNAFYRRYREKMYKKLVRHEKL